MTATISVNWTADQQLRIAKAGSIIASGPSETRFDENGAKGTNNTQRQNASDCAEGEQRFTRRGPIVASLNGGLIGFDITSDRLRTDRLPRASQ